MVLSSLYLTIQYPYTFSLGKFQHIDYFVILLFIHKMKNTLNQSWFFQLVRNEIEPQLSLPDFLFGLFGWSKPTIYKKIRGERTLKMEEFFAIIGELPHLAMSIGEVYKANDLKLVQMHSVSTLNHFQKYLEGIETLFLQMASDPKHSMLYAASDIPIMYYLVTTVQIVPVFSVC